MNYKLTKVYKTNKYAIHNIAYMSQCFTVAFANISIGCSCSCHVNRECCLLYIYQESHNDQYSSLLIHVYLCTGPSQAEFGCEEDYGLIKCVDDKYFCQQLYVT